MGILAKRCVKHAFKRQLSGEPQYKFIYSPAHENCSSWLCLLCSQNLSNRCLQTQIQKTNVLIYLALFHCVLSHFIPCFICTRSRKQQQNVFPARNRAGNTRGSLSLHCSQSLQRTCPKKLFERTRFSITTFCFATLCSTSPVQLYARDHKYLQKNAWRRSTQRAKSEARAWSSSNQRAKQSRALRKNCSKKQLQFTMLCFAPRRSTSFRAFICTGSH